MTIAKPPKVFFSTSTYALGKELGLEQATVAFNDMLERPTNDGHTLPVVRVIARLRQFAEVGLWHDCSATSIGKARSRAFHEALKSKCPTWLVCDDDVECTEETLQHLLAAVDTPIPTVVIAPCVTRGSNVVNVSLVPGAERRKLRTGGECIPALAGGFGLVALNHTALEEMRDRYTQTLTFVDHDGVDKVAVFMEMLVSSGQVYVPGRRFGGMWCGEDVSFCSRALDCGVRLEALVSGLTAHAGVPLQLATVPELGEVDRGLAIKEA